MQFDGYIAHYRKADHEEQRLQDHLLEVAELSKLFAAKIGLQRGGELMGLLHDLGKYSSAFQRYLRSATGLIDPDADDYVEAGALKGKIDHSSAGAQLLWRTLSSKTPLGPFAGQALSLCIASHHSGLIDCLDPAGEDVFTRRMTKDGSKTHLDEARNGAGPEILHRAHELLDDSVLLSEFRLLGSRILKSNLKSRITEQQQYSLLIRFLFSCLIDADRTNTADFENKRVRILRQSGAYAGWELLANRLEDHLARMENKRPVDQLRRDISQHCFDAAKFVEAGTYTLTVPTGGGKTLASLRFALHHALRRGLDRILYVVPFTSIIDQNAETARKVLEQTPDDRGRIVLEIHSNLIPERQSWREKILSENWDAPVIFTTMVQFLDTLFGSGTRGARRMHQLANSVIIFDEIQALPVRCVHLFNNAINFLTEQCNATVVLCTATQPLLHEVSADRGAVRLSTQHEIVPDRLKLFKSLKRVEIIDRRRPPEGWPCEAVADLALEELEREGSCLVIVNTKNAARKIYEAASKLTEDLRVHLSTSMCPAHRKEKLNYVRRRLENGLPVLCISTQLIEAGVDVDFASVIRALAGIDSIAQAAGRCNRNGRPALGRVQVVDIAGEDLTYLPEIRIGAQIAERVLADFRQYPDRYQDDLCGPQAMEDYYRYYFFRRQPDMAYPLSAKDVGQDETILNLLAQNPKAAAEYERTNRTPPPYHFRQAFATAAKAFKAIEAPTEGVVVPFGEAGRKVIEELCSAFEVEKQYRLLRQAQQFTVNVFPHVMRELQEAHAVHPVQPDVRVQHLDSRYYSNEYGLVTEQISGMEMLNA